MKIHWKDSSGLSPGLSSLPPPPPPPPPPPETDWRLMIHAVRPKACMDFISFLGTLEFIPRALHCTFSLKHLLVHFLYTVLKGNLFDVKTKFRQIWHVEERMSDERKRALQITLSDDFRASLVHAKYVAGGNPPNANYASTVHIILKYFGQSDIK